MNATTLKILGIIAMTIDHVGFFLFPKITILRIIGRLTYPIFAYMTAEGCAHTRNKVRYLCTVLGVACVCSAVTYSAGKSSYQSVFTTFSCSIVLIFMLEKAIRATERMQRICRFCFAAVAFIYLYNGKRRKRSLKWFFYGYYPLHIAVLYGIA